MDACEWPQAVIEFTDWPGAEQVAEEHLRPALATAQVDGVISRWWFIRKAPCWRLRYLPADSSDLAAVLDRLATEERIAGWTAGIYEPETHAFGGAAGMDIAHDLFHHDSRNLLDYLARQRTAARGAPDLGRRELAILLCTILSAAPDRTGTSKATCGPRSPSTVRSETPASPPSAASACEPSSTGS